MHLAVVKQFLAISFVYAILCSLVTVAFHPRGLEFMVAMLSAPETHFINLWRYMPLMCLAIVAVGLLTRVFLNIEKMKSALVAIAGCLFFMWGFSMFKSTMPQINPFWADQMLAQFDRTLHFGNDPWVLVEGLRLPLGTEIVDYIYLKFWAWPAIMGPVLLVLFDDDSERLRRYLMLFLFTWIFLGNVLAIIFMSGGPVFYDRIVGGDEFAALTAVLQTPAEQSSIMGAMRNWLWVVNEDGFEGLSSGISAFPSLHVGIAALACVYLWERSHYLAPVGIGFLAFILMGSVLSGLHYAVDGYVSIAIVVAAWAASRRWSRSRAAMGADATSSEISAQTA